MSEFLPYALASIALVCMGLHALLVREHLLRKILALNVMSSGIFLFLVAIAKRNEQGIPDPVPHAMVLTGIVVSVSITALALGIVRRMDRASGGASLDEEEIE